ncbi:MAG: ribosomal protein S19 family protein [Oscillospiraceae bacterium]|nr:ribosomal protein S19 family protein [Oscillospiraceae bacterium]
MPFIDGKKKIQKTWSRASTIFPDFVGGIPLMINQLRVIGMHPIAARSVLLR